MALKFQRGAEAMEQADKSRGGGNRYTPYVKWATGEKKYVQFLTPLDEVPGVLFHQFIITEYNAKGEPTFNNFISPRDKSLDGPSGSDEIQDRFKVNPLYRLFAVAVEVEPVKEKVNGKSKIVGFEPKTRTWTDREDEEHEVPVSGLVIQAKPNFFGHLATWQEETGNEMTSVIWSVSRDTNKKQPTYTFVEVGEALDTEGMEDLPDLDATLQEWGNMDRYEELITPLDDDFPISQYGQRGKKKDDEDAKPARRRSAKVKAEPAEQAEPEEDFESTEEKVSTRKGKLSRLRQSIEEKDEADDAGDDDDE